MVLLATVRDGPRKPPWLKIRPKLDSQFADVKHILKKHNLVTVCEEAHCPNIPECWGGGTATFMVLGDTCTRGCRFCHIKTAKQGQPLDEQEPQKLVAAVKEMGVFDYIVVTSVDRDDLPDQGSGHFAACIRALKQEGLIVEVLIPDFRARSDLLKTIVEAGPDVIAHNVETVKRLQRTVRDRRANYEQSLEVLRLVKELDPKIITKTSFMVGLGETDEELLESMKDLRAIDVDIVTFGQYLRPTKRHLAVKEYIHPDKFAWYKETGEQLGFAYVFSGPFVRSSYRAGEAFVKHLVQKHEKDTAHI